ncbi:hypothetical protein [Geobacter pickeringii]|uniref:Uncharacterized protein n=1 Tax=Geobacter pickeringii TaxID=345632 RepID=A0A0B5BHD5_9BACT|nr:hypothetical protein [Geobacter pickeringii]AJE03441.1 hypothetical protein GPICK_08815 [Geobacter pickeringii]
MAVPQEVIDKIQSYRNEGYSSDEIVQGIIQSTNYKDVARKANSYRKAGYSADEIISGIQASGAQGGTEAPKGYKVVIPNGAEESAAEAMYNAPGELSVDNLKAIIEEKRGPLQLDPAEVDAMQMKFINDEMSLSDDSSRYGTARDVMGISGTAPMRDHTATAAIEAGKRLVRPVFKTAGAVAGAAVTGGPAGAVAGYAMGDEVANLITGEAPASVPTAPAEDVADFATRVLPESVDKNLVGMGKAPAMLATEVVKRTAGGQNPLEAVAGTARDAMTGMGDKVGRVMGFHGIDAMGEELTADPAFAASVLVPGAVAGAKGLKVVGRTAGEIGAGLLGTTTGTGGAAIRQAAKGNPVFRQTMRAAANAPEAVGAEIVDRAKSALQKLRDDRGTAYRAKLAEIAGDMSRLDLSPVMREWERVQSRFGVRKDAAGNLDLSRSTLGRKELSDVQEISDLLNGWGRESGDLTPAGLDLLKRKLDNLYTESKDSRAIVAGLRSTVKKTIVDAVPEYSNMVKGYEEATGLINELERSLALGKKPAMDTTLRRLTQTMKDNQQFKWDLLTRLEGKSGEELADMIAGYTLAPWAPQGGFGKATTLGAAGGVATHVLTPPYLAMLALSSPRVVGESLSRLGATSRVVGEVWRKLPKIRRAVLSGSAPNMVNRQ